MTDQIGAITIPITVVLKYACLENFEKFLGKQTV